MYSHMLKDGQWEDFNRQSVYDSIQQLSSGFLDLGILKGDVIGIYAGNSPFWNIIDFAALQIGAIVVPIDPSFPIEQVQHIFTAHSFKCCFIETEKQLLQIKSLPLTLVNIYSIEEQTECFNWKDLLTELSQEKVKRITEIKANISENDLASIVYSNDLKTGIKLTHKNLLSTLFSLDSILTLDDEKNCIVWQSLTLISERIMSYLYAYNACSIYYLQNTIGFIENAEKIKPHFFTGTNQLLDQIYRHFIDEQKGLKRIKKKGTELGMQIAQKWINGEKPTWDDIRLIIVKQMVFRKWRKELGGNIEGILLDSTPLSPELNKVFNAAGIPIRQSFGLSETSGFICMDRFNEEDALFGSVGRPLPGISIKIDENSMEILCKGPNIVNKQFLDSKTIDEEGWLHTGVTGYIKDGRFLIIEGGEV